MASHLESAHENTQMRRITTKMVALLIVVFRSQGGESVVVLVEGESVLGVGDVVGREAVRGIVMTEVGTDVKTLIMLIYEGTSIMFLIWRLTVVAGYGTARIKF